MTDLAAPAVFEDRPTYRLLAASPGRLTFGHGTYFDGINTGEAAAHEFAAADLDPTARSPLRDATTLTNSFGSEVHTPST